MFHFQKTVLQFIIKNTNNIIIYKEDDGTIIVYGMRWELLSFDRLYR